LNFSIFFPDFPQALHFSIYQQKNFTTYTSYCPCLLKSPYSSFFHSLWTFQYIGFIITQFVT
jgi:hypothetical protein